VAIQTSRFGQQEGAGARSSQTRPIIRTQFGQQVAHLADGRPRQHPTVVRHIEHPQGGNDQKVKGVDAELQQLVLDRDRQASPRDSGATNPADHVLDRRDLGVNRFAQLLSYAEHVEHAGQRRIKGAGVLQ
jgi:hypothetical protein